MGSEGSEKPEEGQKRRGKIRFRRLDRAQVSWVVRDWENALAPDHPARAIWKLTGRLDWSEFEETILSREQASGRPVWEPRLLASVWIYAYTLGVGSARAVERMQSYEPGLQWLTAGESINHHTLSDFRTTETRQLEKLFSRVLAVLDQDGLIDLSVVMQDGTKIQAVAGKQSMHRRKTLEQHLAQARDVVRQLGQQCHSESPEQTEAGAQRRAQRRVAQLEQALEVLAQREQEAEARYRDQVRASESEPEARKMKHTDGGWNPSYNVQIVTEAAHQVIVGITVTDAANDVQELVGGIELVERNLGKKPETMVADGGYASRDNVEQMAQREVVLVSPWKSTEARQAGVEAKHGIQAAFGSAAFVAQGDVLRCPAGKLLLFAGVRILHALPHRVYEANAVDCARCAHKMQCCPKREARQIRQIQESAAMQQYLQRMQQRAMQDLYKKRAEVAEYPNLWMKHLRRWRRFSVRGKVKACREALWRAISYNSEQWIRAFRLPLAA
jgi:transposase